MSVKREKKILCRVSPPAVYGLSVPFSTGGGSHADLLAWRGARPRRAVARRPCAFVVELAFQRSRKKTSSMPSGQQSISTPLVVGEPLVGGFPTDMDIDDDNLGLLDAHDAPSEKVDADFFNGELCHCARTLTPPALRRPPRALPSVAHMSSRRLVPHRFRGRLR